MSKTMTLLVALLVVMAGILLFRDYQRSSGSTASPPNVSGVTDGQEVKSLQDIQNINEWREFVFKPAHFKIWLPAVPQHVTDTVLDPKTSKPHKYETFATAGDNGAAFMVNAITVSESTPINEESLRNVVSSMLERNKDNTLNKMTMGTFHGLRALDFSLNSGNALIVGKIFAQEDTIFILSMIDEKERFNAKEFSFFVNSFEFVK